MSRASGVLAAMKAVPGGARYTPAPQSGGWGGMNQVAANAMYGNPAASQNGYGPFLPRPSRVFTDGAFGPMSPIQPVPVDEPAIPGGFPDPRWWQYRVGWNLPTLPRTEGLSLASFEQLKTIADRYSVLRRCIELRKEEIAGLEWEIKLTTTAAKAYQGDHKSMRDFGERAALATKFFKRPDPDYWNFQSWLKACLEEVFVWDALPLIFRPKYGRGLGRGLLGSDLDSIRLVSGSTIRPLLDMHGGTPVPPSPAYQQYLYGVPRSDYQTVIAGADIDEGGLAGAEVNQFRADTMLYVRMVPRRETPYGFAPVEQALLPVISGLQKQEYQLSYFTEGTIPSVYVSPGDPNMTPTQIRELQDALNGVAGDPAYHLKVIVLPPGSKVDPQRPVDLSDSFDYLVMNQVCMELDVDPTEVGIIPNVGSTSTGPSASGIRFAAQASRDIKSRKSTKPLLMTLCDIANYALQEICGQQDMEFSFEGLQDDEDKAAITTLGVEQVQNGIASIDEVRDRLDLPPWGLQETSEPVVFTAQGPIPFSMAPQLIAAMQGAAQGGGQGTNSGQRTTSSRSRTSQPSVRSGGQTKPNGSHPKPVAPHRESVTPGHSAAAGAVQGPSGRTGGTTSRSPVAGSRKRGEGHTDLSRKAAQCELEALRRHLHKGRDITTWVPEHIPGTVLAIIAEDLTKGIGIDEAVTGAADVTKSGSGEWEIQEESRPFVAAELAKAAHWPGWERDLGLVGAYKNLIGKAFRDAETRGSALRKKAATGGMFVSNGTLRDLISDEVRETFSSVLTPLWTQGWHLGYAAAKSLVTGEPADFTAKAASPHLDAFIGSEEDHWLQQISRTGLDNASARSEAIAWTEVGRAINTAAIQCYRDHGVSHKHLLLSPNACDLCKDAAEDGDIPLDAPFSAGGVIGQVHVRCRCAPGPAGVDVEPPLADLGKSAGIEDESRLVWLLLRARDEDGKWRFLLQQRPDGSWGMPGGKPHVGEDPWAAVLRETEEEIGKFPPPYDCAGTFHHVEDDGKTQVYLYLCTVPYFHPAMDGSTPDETRGVAWFRRKEVGNLDLAPKFREDWERGICLKDHATKSLQRVVGENGEVSVLTPAAQRLEATGARWPYPRRSDGTEDPAGSQHWPDAGPGAYPGASPGDEPPNHVNDMAQPEPHGEVEPRGGQDGKMPRGRKPNPAAQAFPNQGTEHDEMWPAPQTTLTPPGSSIGARTGVPPSGEKHQKVTPESVNYRPARGAHRCGNCVMFHPAGSGDGRCDILYGLVGAGDVCDRWEARAAEKDSAHPVVGSVPAQAPKPYKPRSVPPEAFDPADTVEQWSDADQSNVVHDLPQAKKGAQHVTDPNPVEWRHVYAQLEQNFPAEAIGWVKRARWIGPVNVPWSRVDDDDADKWAASHQPEAVSRFAKAISAGTGHTNPSILVQHPHTNRAFIVDGHHRALARRKLGKPVLAYVGNIDPRDREAAEQTHSFQQHQGSDPQNKSEQTPVASTVHHPLGHEGLWHTPDRHVGTAQQLPAYFQNTARALMRDHGMGEHEAIPMAIRAVDGWRHGRAFGGKVKVTPEVQQAAQRAWDEWERLKESHHG